MVVKHKKKIKKEKICKQEMYTANENISIQKSPHNKRNQNKILSINLNTEKINKISYN